MGAVRDLMAPSTQAEELRELATRLARQAGALLSRRPTAFETGTKSSPTDLVTAADRAAERLIVEGIRTVRPDDTLLAEEGGGRAGTSGIRWVVDPLDGTVNYVYGIPAYGVSIAAEAGGVAIAGAVYDVTRDILYDAARGGGARANGLPLHCTGATDPALSMVGTGFSYSASDRALQGRVLADLLPRVRDIRRFGAAALDLCAVGAGQLDAFYEAGLKPWDWAAGLLVATEAGACAARFPTPIGEVLVAAAPGLLESLVDLLIGLHETASSPS